MSKYYVYSTMSQDVRYSLFDKPKGEGVATVLRSVLVKGGAGVINPRNMITPIGVATAITEEDRAMLEGGEGAEPNKLFKRHEKNGFVRIDKKASSMEKAIKDMQPKDNSAQKVKKDFEDSGAKVHSVGSQLM